VDVSISYHTEEKILRWGGYVGAGLAPAQSKTMHSIEFIRKMQERGSPLPWPRKVHTQFSLLWEIVCGFRAGASPASTLSE